MNFCRSKYIILFLSVLLTACSAEDSDEKKSGESNKLSIGASANDFLSDEKYTALEIEIVYVDGYAPTQTALTELKTFFNKYTFKPGGVSIFSTAIGAPNMGTYSLTELKSIEDQYRTRFTSGNTLTAFVFFADKKSETATSTQIVIGKAYRNTSMVIFEKEVRDLAESSSNTSISEVEHTTLRHEFGHLFGLVNTGSPAQTDHEDKNPDYKGHCNVDGCLMAALIEFRSPNIITGSQGILELDDKCHLDLIANGGK